MTRAEWIELALVAVVAAASSQTAQFFQPAIPLWQIVLGLSALVLAQSLVRDVAILIRQRRTKSSAPKEIVQCFCLESTIGATGVAAGAALVGLGVARQFTVSPWKISVAVAATMILGLVIKDLVISWKPPRVRREKDHVNLLVRWKMNIG